MEIRKVKIKDLNPATYNPRNISEESLKGLEASLSRFGYVEPICWNEKTGNVVGGHQRLKVLQKKGEKEVEVVVVSLNEIDEKALNVALNNKHIQGDWDYGKLDILLSELKIEFDGYDEIKLDALEIEMDDNIEPEEKEIVEDEASDKKEDKKEFMIVVTTKTEEDQSKVYGALKELFEDNHEIELKIVT